MKQNQFLVLDTAFFSESFKQRLVSSIDNLDQQCDGLMINSENFQALNLLQEKYKQQVKCIYIDPPYNTSEGSFIYKNLYKDSCWMTMMEDRITIARDFMNNDSVIDTAIDDFELANLQKLYDTVFGSDKRLGNLVIEIKPSGRTNDNYLATSHDYVVMYATEPYNAEISFFELSEEQKGQYKYQESGVAHKWRDFMRTGGFSTPEERPNSFYPIYYEPSTNDISLEKIDGYVEILPIDSEGKYRVWRKTKPSFLKHLDNKEIKIELAKRNSITKYKVRIIDIIKEGVRPKSVWTGSKYDASSHGTKLLKKMFGDSSPFSFPKALCATQDTIFLSVANDDSAIILDFFAGSGTTGHSVININRNDTEKGEYACRKYILVEMGEYFNSVTKPRIQKVVYSKDWSDGKPVDREGISHCFKYMRLEQYEDTLNNLIVKENEGLFGESDEYRDSYMLGYMLDTETRDSLFNLKWFENPFDVTLNVTRKNEIVSQKIDLVETFNYLIGLNVDFISYPKDGICTVEGTTRKGEKSLIIWRDCEKISNDTLENFFSKSAYSTRDSEFDRIYINGDCKIENFRSEDQSWKVILTEEEFSKRMFEE